MRLEPFKLERYFGVFGGIIGFIVGCFVQSKVEDLFLFLGYDCDNRPLDLPLEEQKDYRI